MHTAAAAAATGTDELRTVAFAAVADSIKVKVLPQPHPADDSSDSSCTEMLQSGSDGIHSEDHARAGKTTNPRTVGAKTGKMDVKTHSAELSKPKDSQHHCKSPWCAANDPNYVLNPSLPLKKKHLIPKNQPQKQHPHPHTNPNPNPNSNPTHTPKPNPSGKHGHEEAREKGVHHHRALVSSVPHVHLHPNPNPSHIRISDLNPNPGHTHIPTLKPNHTPRHTHNPKPSPNHTPSHIHIPNPNPNPDHSLSNTHIPNPNPNPESTSSHIYIYDPNPKPNDDPNHTPSHIRIPDPSPNHIHIPDPNHTTSHIRIPNPNPNHTPSHIHIPNPNHTPASHTHIPKPNPNHTPSHIHIPNPNHTPSHTRIANPKPNPSSKQHKVLVPRGPHMQAPHNRPGAVPTRASSNGYPSLKVTTKKKKKNSPVDDEYNCSEASSYDSKETISTHPDPLIDGDSTIVSDADIYLSNYSNTTSEHAQNVKMIYDESCINFSSLNPYANVEEGGYYKEAENEQASFIHDNANGNDNDNDDDDDDDDDDDENSSLSAYSDSTIHTLERESIDGSHGHSKASSEVGTRPGTEQRRRKSYIYTGEEEEADKITLRKQMTQEGKRPEDWILINRTLKQAVHRLAPNEDKKVKVLVQAFEYVLTHPESSGVEGTDQANHHSF